jgi:hypothetical protein
VQDGFTRRFWRNGERSVIVPPVRPRGRCVFCNQLGSSEEDVFARWLTKALGGPGPTGFHLRRSSGRDRLNTSTLRLTTRAVCRECNNGWMSQSEQAVRPVLTPMLRMQTVRLAKEEVATLAQWVFKTALMFDRAAPPNERTVPDEHFRYLFQHRVLPPSVAILSGCYLPIQGEEPWAAWGVAAWLSAALPNGTKMDGYRVTFSIGHAIFQTFGTVPVDREGYVFESGLTRGGKPVPEAVPRLWPLEAEPFHWPPRSGVTFATDGLQLLVNEGR